MNELHTRLGAEDVERNPSGVNPISARPSVQGDMPGVFCKLAVYPPGIVIALKVLVEARVDAVNSLGVFHNFGF